MANATSIISVDLLLITGYNHPRVTEAIRKTNSSLIIYQNYYAQDKPVELSGTINTS